MLLQPHYVYGFSFTSLFESLNGIYKILAIYSYDEVLNIDIDLYKETYEPLAIDKEDYLSVINLIRGGRIYKLEQMNQDYETIRYVPESIISGIPDASVKKFFNLGLAVELGIFDNENMLTDLKTQIEEIVEAQTGSVEKTVVYSIEEKWMTIAEFEVIDQERKDHVFSESSLYTLSTAFLVRNNFTDKVALQIENDRLKTIIANYEELLKEITV